MPTTDLALTLSTTANAGGAGSVKFQPTVVGQKWNVQLVTATSNDAAGPAGPPSITVTRNGYQLVDSTSNDTRPSVTSDSTYTLAQGETLTVAWTGAAAGAHLVATVTGEISWGE